MKKRDFLDLIKSNINEYGYHVTTVISGTNPRFAYTIGLSKLLGFEVIFAGGINYLKHDMALIIDKLVNELSTGTEVHDVNIVIDSLGSFGLKAIDNSWCKIMMLGVFDYYKTDEIKAFQIMPEKAHRTLDVPNMSLTWSPTTEPVWRWLDNKWDYPVAENSTVATHLAVLLGQPVTEITRWEDDYWEMFAGAAIDVQKDDMRVVSIGTMLAIDNSLLPAIHLKIGEGLWRGGIDSGWNNWQ